MLGSILAVLFRKHKGESPMDRGWFGSWGLELDDVGFAQALAGIGSGRFPLTLSSSLGLKPQIMLNRTTGRLECC